MSVAPVFGLAMLALVATGSCRDDWAQLGNRRDVPRDVERGRTIISQANCGVCHDIPGVEGAHGRTAVPLDGFARRSYVGGVLPNTPANVARWVQDPVAVDPLTAMPTVELSDQDARDVAAFLLALR